MSKVYTVTVETYVGYKLTDCTVDSVHATFESAKEIVTKYYMQEDSLELTKIAYRDAWFTITDYKDEDGKLLYTHHIYIDEREVVE